MFIDAGRHYQISSADEARIFSLQGKKISGKSVILNEQTEHESHPSAIVDQLGNLLAGVDVSSVDRIFISSYIAMQLFLEGILRASDFSQKIEDDNSLTILGVMISGASFDLFIRDEGVVGRECLRLIGKDGVQL